MGKPAVDDPNVVRGRCGGIVSTQVMVAMCAIYVAGGVLGHSWGLLVAGILYVAAIGVLSQRRPTRVDPTGISIASWKWSMRRLTWTDVSEVVRTGRSDQVTSIRLSNGEVVRLVDIPADQASKIARIGEKPLVAPPPLPSDTHSPRRPTDAENDRELARRVHRLAEDRARLQSQLVHRTAR